MIRRVFHFLIEINYKKEISHSIGHLYLFSTFEPLLFVSRKSQDLNREIYSLFVMIIIIIIIMTKKEKIYNINTHSIYLYVDDDDD